MCLNIWLNRQLKGYTKCLLSSKTSFIYIKKYLKTQFFIIFFLKNNLLTCTAALMLGSCKTVWYSRAGPPRTTKTSTHKWSRNVCIIDMTAHIIHNCFDSKNTRPDLCWLQGKTKKIITVLHSSSQTACAHILVSLAHFSSLRYVWLDKRIHLNLNVRLQGLRLDFYY